ncbi:MAG: glycosyltransferase [Chloroflexi bacterium]|nr:glycosyltransferase [Chloroflexota bacterium]
MITFSIVTPSFNQGAYLEATIQSVLEQAYPAIQYMVVDGGSSDNSADVIRRYAERLAYWVSEPDRGQSHAINKGWRRATGEVVAWLNSDDMYLPGTLRRVAQIFDRDAAVGLVYGDCIMLDERSGESAPCPAGPPTLASLLRDANGIPQPSAFVRRSILDRVGLLDESLHLAMDYDLWLRVLAVAPGVRVGGEPLAVIRDHPGTKTRRQATAFLHEFRRVIERFYRSGHATPEANRVRAAAHARVYYALAEATLLSEGDARTALGAYLRAVRWDPSLLLRIPRAARKLRARSGFR